MLGQESWAASHLLSLLGLVVIAVTLVGAYQTSAFGARSDVGGRSDRRRRPRRD